MGVWSNAEAVAALPLVLWFNVGMSAATMARGLSAPGAPFGAARKKFAVCAPAAVTARVPVLVIGDPDTLSHEGTVIATEVTPVPAGVEQVRAPVELCAVAKVPPAQAVGV